MGPSHDSIRILIVSLLIAGAASTARAYDNVRIPESQWSFALGGGYSPVVGGLNHTLTDGWNLGAGVGYKFTQEWGLNLEYMNNHLGVDNGVLHRYSNLMGGIPTDGDASVWSVTLNPMWSFEINRVVGGYLIGGGGYYHANAQITTPGLAFMPPYCDYYWGCWPGGVVPADKLIGERKDDTGGVNAGFGFTFHLRSGTEFYIESRYHYILTHGPDLQLFPLTAGFRFN